MRLLRWFKDYFDMSRSERNGSLLLLGIIVLIITAQYVLAYQVPAYNNDFSAVEKLAAAFSQQRAESETDESSAMDWSELEKLETSTLKPFPFDPNTLDEAGFKSMGLRPKLISNILNYRNKGGKFYNAESLGKLYAIKPEEFAKLRPYIVIASGERDKKGYTDNKEQHSYEPKRFEPVMVELNNADSASLDGLKGIGPAFASRILKFRNSLGGFHSIEQLREVYGIDSARYEQIANQLTITTAQLKKININTVNYEDLTKHPYIRSKIANLIVQYRKQHGPYKSVDELQNIKILKPEEFRKMIPYLYVE